MTGNDNLDIKQFSEHEKGNYPTTSTALLKNQNNLENSPGQLLLQEDSANLRSVNVRRNQLMSQRDFDPGPQYNVDVSGSTYALQVAFKNMKERHLKLQKKLAVLEEENTRLIGGKSELFGEIGKMQESSIKLREKNLQLNHEVHSKHQECCSVKDKLTSYCQENMKLTSKLLQATNEKKKLSKQVEDLDQENIELREGLNHLLNSCRSVPGLNLELSRIEAIASRSKLRSDYDRTRIPMRSEHKSDIYEVEQVSESDDEIDNISMSECSTWLDNAKDTDTLAIEAFDRSKKMMRKMKSIMLKQKEDLLSLGPQFELAEKFRKESLEKMNEQEEAIFNSRFATFHSTNNPATITLAEDGIHLSGSLPINDSGGETNVLVEEKIVSGRQSPFDWRQVQVSDDDTNEPSTLMQPSRPQMRTVSTSPDANLMFDLSRRRPSTMEEEDRTCPMCNAVFPVILPQETFESHVVSHFEVENGFEVIT